MNQQTVEAVRPSPTYGEVKKVVLVDVHIPFGSMVTLMVKFAIAAIPAAIILAILGALVMAVFTGMVMHH